ncbi:MAG: protein-glutamate O-methyltransferase CheR [Thermodesulfobacteriota bacterium]|nr:protein-glutamate O-methyltransferase CheR [Thermodesulfobacteriota bacterium]
MQKYIEEQCGIRLEKGKEYLIESRLTDLVIENGCKSFKEFHSKAQSDSSGKLRDRIVDAMTTNETLFFRDNSAWEYIKEVAVPMLLDKAEKGEKARIWSAAASTGQEAYSLLMLLHDMVKTRGKPDLLDKIEIIGTDISTSALFLAISARYDSMSVARGTPQDKKKNYFTQNGNVWEFDQVLKKRVTFKQFNLQNNFRSLGVFDLILCRYVAIYFSNLFKRELFSKMSRALKPGCVLMLGATESLRGLSKDFKIMYHKDAVINEKL